MRIGYVSNSRIADQTALRPVCFVPGLTRRICGAAILRALTLLFGAVIDGMSGRTADDTGDNQNQGDDVVGV